WLRGRPATLDAFFRIALPLTELVARLHGRNVIHADLSPTNVVVDERDRVTLIDFESAATVADPGDDGVRAAGEPPYMSPERTGRMNRPIDRRADLYSLGATLYEMLSGAPPFPSGDPVEVVHAHLALPPRPIAGAPAVLSD